MSLDLPIDEDLLARLPLPLAQLYRRAHYAKTPLEHHLTSFYLWEAALKLLGATALAHGAARGEADDPRAEAVRDLARPTLGHWWEFACRLVPVLAEQQQAGFPAIRLFLFGLPHDDLPRAAYLNELLLESVKGRRAACSSLAPRELVENLIAYRNREIGHGAGAERAPEFHERMAGALLGAFAEVAGQLDVLAGGALIHVARVEGATDGYLVDVARLRGDGPPETATLQLPVDGPPLEARHLYLAAANWPPDVGGLVALHPLIRFEAESGAVFFPTRRDPGQAAYLCYTTGEERAWPLPGTDGRDLLPHAPRPADAPITAHTMAEPPLEPTLAAPLPVIRDYQVQEVLGRGGMGTVYRAWQPSLGRKVALKVMHNRGDPVAEGRFLREIEALARVDHPNVVRIYDSGKEGDQLYYVMEFLEGRTLSQGEAAPRGADDSRRPDVPQLVRLVRQVADALHALHEAGIIHRDPKPSNIMVTPDGSRAVLLDLGLARLPDDEREPITATGGFIGTPAYCSPEQTMDANRVDRRSDIYTLGVTLWEVLAGRRLFDAPAVFEVVQRIRTEEPESVRKYNPAVPADLDAVVRKCLEKDPARRYDTAREMSDELGRVLNGEPVRARQVRQVERLWRWCRRRPEVVGTVAVSLAVIALLMTAFSWRFSAVYRELADYKARSPVPEEVVRQYEDRIQQLEGERDDYKAKAAQQPGGEVTRATFGGGYAGWAVAAVLGALLTAVLVRQRKSAASAVAAPTPPRDRPAEGQPSAKAPPPRPPLAPLPPRPKPLGEDEAFSSQTVVLRYPAPVAIAYRRFCARREPPDRLAQLFGTFEIALKYLVYLGLADLCQCRLKAGPPYQPLPKHQGFDLTRRPTRMTLGQWARSLRDCADVLAKEDGLFVPELPKVCGPNGFLDVEIIRWIGANRNLAAHPHGGISLTSEKCEPLLREARPKLERLLQEIAFLRRYPLGFVTAGHPLPGDRRRYRVHSCMGARVAFGEEVYPLETKLRLPEGIPFVVAPNESAVLCLWPFLLQRESDFTQRPALYVFEEIDADRRCLTKVKAAAIDHEDVWPKELHPSDAADHGWLWEALAKLPQTAPIAPELRLAEGLAESLVGRLSGESLGEGKHYKLLGPIARGGFGTVYDAVDERSNTRVAVKVLEDHEVLDAKDDRNQFRRFQQEYEKLKHAGAEHRGIVRCFEWGADIIGRREYPWYSMEFAAGGDLNDRLHERRAALQGRLPWDDAAQRAAAVEEFRAIADAVAHLHDSNVIHRDVKPANVLVMEGGELRLSDFGLIKELERPHAGASVGPGSSRGAVLGTRDYMAPEQERGDAVTKAADVYALGVVLAELLTGQRPQPARGLSAGSPLEHDEHLDRLPEPLRRLVLHATDMEAERRPADAHGLLHLFELALKKAQV